MPEKDNGNGNDISSVKKKIETKKPIDHKKIIIILAAVLIIIIAVVLIVVGSCSNKDSKIVETTESEPIVTTTQKIETTTTQVETTETESMEVEFENHLTGLEMGSEELTGQRPVAFMINNVKVATPHIGVGHADMVFEMEVEYGLTRMMAYFASVDTVPEIGSIRSVRHNFVDLAGAFDAIPVHVGASYMGNNQMGAQNTDHLDYGVLANKFWRDEAWMRDRGYEHSVRTTGELLRQAIDEKGMRIEIDPDHAKPFNFIDGFEIEPAGDIDAYKADIPLTYAMRASVNYNEEEQAYEKTQHGAVQVDFVDGKPYCYTNVLIIRTNVSQAEGILREIDLKSGGSGYYLSGGKATEINWSKGGTYDQFKFTYADGNEVEFNRGKFYIAVISQAGDIIFSGKGD